MENDWKRKRKNWKLKASLADRSWQHETLIPWIYSSVIFVNENENENGEKRENNELVNKN